MSLGALVQQVGEVLGRAHLLFGDPPASGGVAALDAGSGLAAAGDLVRGGQARMTGLSGVLPAKYGGFATDAGAALDGAAGTDSSLGGWLDDAAGADRSGRASSGAVVNGAAADTAGLAPVSGTAPGQRALIAALRARVAQQQQVVNAHKALDARLAATVRELAYARRRGAGGMPMGGMPFGGGGFGGGADRLCRVCRACRGCRAWVVVAEVRAPSWCQIGAAAVRLMFPVSRGRGRPKRR